jgi:hypothetical protein
MFTLLGVLLFVLVAGGLVWIVESQMWGDSIRPSAMHSSLPPGSSPVKISQPGRRPRCLAHRNRWAVWLPIPLPFLARRLAVLIVIKF